jgi:predicted molibdopterin-dependent oxidoreductase YjgC
VIEVFVDDRAVQVEESTTALEAVRQAGGDVATLCFDDRVAAFGACRVCLVAVEGAPAPLPSCTTVCRAGMRIATDDERALRIASNVVELVLSELPGDPGPHTELAAVAEKLGVGAPRWTGRTHEIETDARHPYLLMQHELCISCGRCVRVCDEVQGAFALTATGRGFDSNIAAGLNAGFERSSCVSCGACADTCPTDAITEHLLVEIADPAGEEELVR